MSYDKPNTEQQKKRLAMPDSVFIGCEQHANECEKCQSFQQSQVSSLTCQLCDQPVYFCRVKPCQFKLHCTNESCQKSKHEYKFVSKNNDSNRSFNNNKRYDRVERYNK